MDTPHNTIKPKIKTVILIAYSLFFTGLVLILLSILASEIWHWPICIVAFLRDVGLLLSAVMAISLLHEKLLRDEMIRFAEEQINSMLDAHIPKPKENANLIAQTVHQLFKESPPQMTGLRLISGVRRSFSGYYQWVNDRTPQDLFFAGRSVLHRIDADIKANSANPDSSAENVLLRRLKEGSKIKILFLDPRTNILDRLSREEGQTLEALLGDIATSLGICQRLHHLLKDNYKSLSPNSGLSIRVYDRVPYFAYHKQDNEVIIGFYFLSSIGSSSAAYEIVDNETKQVFGENFIRIMSDASPNTLVEFDGARGRPNFNKSLFDELRKVLEEQLTKEKTNQLIDKAKNI
jgi:hypothetical protein